MQLPLWLRQRQLCCGFHVLGALHRSNGRRSFFVLLFVVLVVFVFHLSILFVVVIIHIISVHIGCWCARRKTQHGQNSR
jgi:uncharacterized protein HemY